MIGCCDRYLPFLSQTACYWNSYRGLPTRMMAKLQDVKFLLICRAHQHHLATQAVRRGQLFELRDVVLSYREHKAASALGEDATHLHKEYEMS